MRFYTADHHFGHARIVELCRRPFPNVAYMNAALVEQWNRAVGVEDEVFVLGDFALGKVEETLELVSELNGRKVLVSGNHDRTFAGQSKRRPQLERWTQAYLDAGFAEVHPGAPLYDHELAGYGRVTLSHFPVVGDSYSAVDRYADWRPDARRAVVHGHVHGEWRVRTRPVTQLNVGVDVSAFAPVSERYVARQLHRLDSLGPAAVDDPCTEE